MDTLPTEAIQLVNAFMSIAAGIMVVITGTGLTKWLAKQFGIEISDNQDQYLMQRFSRVLRLPLLGFGIVALLGLVSALLGWSRSRDVRVLAAFVALYCASIVVFFLFSRYRLPVVPFILR